MRKGFFTYPLITVMVLMIARLSCLGADQDKITFPASVEWALAGVEGGMPAKSTVIANLKPGDDLQAAVDSAPASGGVIRLAAGNYPLTQTLRLRSHVVLEGIDAVRTRLVLKMRSLHPEVSIMDEPAAWTSGVLLSGIERAGLENLTVAYDNALGTPPDPKKGLSAYADDLEGRDDLHVVSVLFVGARNCWMTGCFIDNAGSDPLVIADSDHVQVEKVETHDSYNRGPGSGLLALISCRHVLLDQVRVRGINSILIHGSRKKIDCRYNVIANCSFEVDMRLHNRGTQDNLIEQTEIAVPPWLERTPLSPGDAKYDEAPPGPDNLLYLCTITRRYATGRRAFSMADNPNMVYEVLQTYARERSPSCREYGPAPMKPSLWKNP